MNASLTRIGILALASVMLAGCSQSLFMPAPTPTTPELTAPPYVPPTAEPSASPTKKKKKDQWGQSTSWSGSNKPPKHYKTVPSTFPAGVPVPVGTLSSVSYNSASKQWQIEVRVPSSSLRKDYIATRAKFESAGFQAMDPASGKYVPLSKLAITASEDRLMLRGLGYDIFLLSLDFGNVGGTITMTMNPTK